MSAPAPAAACCLVIMGVSACGKSTVGRALATRLHGRFVDGDDHHPPENVAKMTAGIPLTDADRQPWLDRLHAIMAEHLASVGASPLVVACSALSRRYRDRLRGDLPYDRIRFVHLATDFDTALGRLEARQDHFMRGRHILEDQFAALEPLEADELASGGLVLDASSAAAELGECIVAFMGRPA